MAISGGRRAGALALIGSALVSCGGGCGDGPPQAGPTTETGSGGGGAEAVTSTSAAAGGSGGSEPQRSLWREVKEVGECEASVMTDKGIAALPPRAWQSCGPGCAEMKVAREG